MQVLFSLVLAFIKKKLSWKRPWEEILFSLSLEARLPSIDLYLLNLNMCTES